MRPRKTVAVAGATGRLGAIVPLLLSRGHEVRALTRAPASAAAIALAEQGADVIRADFDDPAAVAAASVGADALFATGTAHRVGPEGELRHGLNIADAAAAAGVGHLVFVSGDGAAADSPLPLFRAKHRVEEHIGSAGISNTILAPVYFMENLLNPWNLPYLRSGSLPSPISVDAPLQQAAVADVVALAAAVIEAPTEFAGRRVRIASDELSANVAAGVLARATGRAFEAERIDPDTLPPGLAALFGWLESVGHSVEIAALHREHPEVPWHSYARWVRAVSPRFREFCPHPALAGP